MKQVDEVINALTQLTDEEKSKVEEIAKILNRCDDDEFKHVVTFIAAVGTFRSSLRRMT